CIWQGRLLAACVAVSLTGALVGFLRYNYPPAKVFLGDSGSMLIGLVVGVLGLQCSLKGPTTVALAAPLALMAIPVLAPRAAIIRRKLTGRSIYMPDRGHLHHCLQRRGLSNNKILAAVSLLCLFTVLGGLGSMLWKNEALAVVPVAATIGFLVATKL